MKKIILTGGGSAGHVNGNIALIPGLREKEMEMVYIGSRKMEEDLISNYKDIKYYKIPSGMLRRYFSWDNFSDILKVLKGIKESLGIISREKPDVIFSKGGFVTVPVAIAAKIKGVPFICHESDLTPGLANKIASKFARRVLYTFPETGKYLGENSELVGSPVREELFAGNREKGLEFLGFSGTKPILLVMGGSMGSKLLNEAIYSNLESFREIFDIVHHVGKDNLKVEYEGKEGYRQFSYINEELKDVLKATDIAISRAGSNSIFEFLALKIPNLLIPLEKGSRGDQVDNAASFENLGYSMVLKEDEISEESLRGKLLDLWKKKDEYIERMNKANIASGTKKILDIIFREIK